MSKLAAALALAADGYRVFPLAINGKTPAIDGNWRKIATTDPARIESMWRCPVLDTELDYNIGIALPADVLAIDVDVRDGKQGLKSLAATEAIYGPLPATATTITPSGGEHRLFKVPASGNFAKTLSTDIDLKGEGGYVVAPGSEINGRFYVSRDARGELLFNGASEDTARRPALPRADDLEQLPRIYCEEFSRRGPSGNQAELRHNRGQTPQGLSDGNRRRAIEWLESRAPEAVEGANGDRITYEVACRIRDFDATADECFDLLADHWNDDKAFPPWDQDDLRKKVENAYDYAQDAPGKRNPEAEFDAVEIDQGAAPPPKRKGLYPIRWQQAEPVLDYPYLIDGILDSGIMAVTYGDSNVGKTYVKLDQAFHIAAGKDWNGHKVKQGLVVYVAAEGGTGFLKRIAAFKKHYQTDVLPFSLVPCPIDLQSEAADTAKLLKLIRTEEEHFGQKCVLIVIDTLARAMAGGDENTAVDMSKFVGHADRLRAAIGATVDIIHHTGKDASKGARGSSALRAATDTEIEVGEGTLSVTKQRDMRKADVLRFELEELEIGRRADGAPVGACIVRWVTASEFDERLSPQAAEMLAVLERLLAARRDEITEDESIPETDKNDKIAQAAVPWKEWETVLAQSLRGPRGKPLGRTHLYPLRQELTDTGRIVKNKRNEWHLK